MPGVNNGRGLAGSSHEIAQRCVSLAQIDVAGHHVGQAARVRQQVADGYFVFSVGTEFGHVFDHGIVGVDQSLFDQFHQAASSHGFADGRYVVNRIGFRWRRIGSEVASAAGPVEKQFAMLFDPDRGRTHCPGIYSVLKTADHHVLEVTYCCSVPIVKEGEIGNASLAFESHDARGYRRNRLYRMAIAAGVSVA